MRDKKINSQEIKIKNRNMVYHYIRNKKSVSKQDIVFGLQLSLPTVTQNIQHLEKQGLIDTSKRIKNTGGRNAIAYTYIRNAKLAIGVYTTAYHISAVAVDLSGNVVEMVKERATFNLDDDEYLKKIGEAVERVKVNANIADEELLGVGIAVQGLVSKDGEKVLYGLTLNFTGKTREEIAKYIPYENFLFHDSYAAGYAEVWSMSDLHNAFYISLSNSVGGSVIINKDVYAGDTDKGGEIGHMIVENPKYGEQCYCGKHGCFDTVCSANKLSQGGSLEAFFCLLKDEDPEAQKTWDTYLDHLAHAVINIRMLFDNTIIIGGYVGAFIDDYMDDLYRRVDEYNPFNDKAEEYLIPCKFKVEATAAGAAIFYINSFIENL